MHGDYKLKPHRAIMIRTGGSLDAAQWYASHINAPEAVGEIHSLLLPALIPKSMRRTPPNRRLHRNVLNSLPYLLA